MLRRFAVAFSLITVLSASASAAERAATPPNIVFILADDLGVGDVKCFNAEGKIPTPQLDALAKRGMMLTAAHTSSAVCTPTRYNLLTGRYNWRSRLKQGVLGGFSPALIEPDRLTVAELLRRRGYATAMVGKWHLGLEWARNADATDTEKTKSAGESGDNNGRVIDFTRPFGRGPTTLGFQEFFGISASLDMPPYAYLEQDRVTKQPTLTRAFPWVGSKPEGRKTRTGPAAGGFDTVDVLPDFTRRAVDFIGRKAADAKSGKPFFLYVPLASPHTPLAPTAEWRGKSGLNDYADFMMQTDAAVGEIVAALEKHGVAENTLLIFTSDNGCSPEADYPFLTSHGHDPSAGRRGHKADLYEGGQRVPLLVHWPARVAAGKRSDAFVSLGDFMATCAEITGEKLPDNAGEDSFSFLSLITGKTTASARDTIVFHSINGSFGIRQGKWKLLLAPDSGGWSFPRPGRDKTDGLPRFQLFDLVADPAEKTNVQAANPDVVARLGRALREIVEAGRSTPGAKQANAGGNWPQAKVFDEFK